MKIELDKNQIDEVTKSTIASLEKEVKTLRAKIGRREKELAHLKNGMDVTKERRIRIKSLAESLSSELEEAGWVDLPDYGH